MSTQDVPEEHTEPIETARVEAVLREVDGVLAVRVMIGDTGTIEAVHVLAGNRADPASVTEAVRTALDDRLSMEVGPENISIAFAPEPDARVAAGPIESPWAPPHAGTPRSDRGRILFLRHRVERARSRTVQMSVDLEWEGVSASGSARGPDLPRSRQEIVANATLQALEGIVSGCGGPEVSLSLDGVERVDAFDQRYVLVSVHILARGELASLSGIAAVEGDVDLGVIFATLRASNRVIQSLLGIPPREAEQAPPTTPEDPASGDPFQIWGRS